MAGVSDGYREEELSRLINAVLVPPGAHGCLEASGCRSHQVLLSIDTDVSLEGQTAREWLLVTPDRLSVMVESNQSKVLRSINTDDVESVRTTAGVGSGMLQAKVGGKWIDLLRFSNALATRFHKISRALEQACEGRESGSHAWEQVGHYLLPSSEEHVEPLDPPRCPSCNLRLSVRDEGCPRCLQKGQILRRVKSLLAPDWRGAVFLCLLTVLGVAAELIPPKLQQYLVDHVLMSPANAIPAEGAEASGSFPFTNALLVVVLALAGSRILLSIVGVFKGQLATAIGTGLTSQLRAQMVQKLQSMAVAYYDRHQVGSMLSRVAHDSEVLHGFMHQLTGGFLLQSVQLVGVGAMLLWLNPKLAIFTLIPVPLVFLGSWIFWQKVYPRYYRLWDASSKQMSVLSGMLSGIRVVKAFAQEDREYAKFQNASDHLRQWRLWVEGTNAWYSAAMSLVFSLGGLIVWYVGGRDVIGRDMTLGELIAFLAYLAMFYAPLSGLTSFTSWLTSFLSGTKRVLELLDTPQTIIESPNPKAWDDPRGEIVFQNVTFGYDRNQPVLRNISFRVAPGEMVGIVGRSGSGKTTMVNLLGRFYDVQEGQVLVDGVDIRQLSTQQLRQHLGIVFQDSFLFRGTIWKNLAYGRPLTTLEEGLIAAKAAGAHDFICRQPLAYETLLGEHGAGLSGGEKQRLSIARTLLYDPRILVLDEATSNIDAEAEKSIQEALEVLIRGRTTVAIAHRLSTLRNADRILVFDRGRLIEEGSHAELLAKDGTYAKLVRIQTQVSKDPSVDRIMQAGLDAQQAAAVSAVGSHRDTVFKSQNATSTMVLPEPSETSESTGPEAPKHVIQWLDPDKVRFASGTYGKLEVLKDGDYLTRNGLIVQTFPATQPEAYLSVREFTDSGDEVEVGMIRDLAGWSESSAELIRRSLRQRYLLYRIRHLKKLKLSHGFLDFEVETDLGPKAFSLRWSQSQAIDFGETGKMLIDIDENRYLVEDVDRMPLKERELFLQYIYW